MAKVALDVMGGDHSPDAAIDGALRSIERGFVAGPEELVLVGAGGLIAEGVERRGVAADRFEVVDAPDILAGESPVEATRRKPRNSIAVGISLVKEGRADAFVSAGNTGLVVATAILGLRCLEGIRRPGIAVTINGEKGPFTVVDVGANPQPKAVHLLHYALMGSAYFHDTFGVERPRVAMLNIGSEDQKGNPLVKEAKELIRAADLNFVGNVEGVDVFSGGADVIVCDGFTGNVLLKVSEGVAEYLLRSFGRQLAEAGVDREVASGVVGKVMHNVDYSEYGGALLLGVEGIVTICHGRSEGPAICNAIRFASRAVGARVNEHIVNAARATQAAG